MNLFNLLKPSPDVTTSILYDESTFYQAFMRDLRKCEQEVIIESPFITTSRVETLYPIFKRILDRGIKIHIITRDPSEHNEEFRYQSTDAILRLADLGVNVVLPKGNYHRKLAIIDRKTIWEGSLNILSQSKSKEIMRKIDNVKESEKLLRFIKIDKVLML